MSPGVAVATVAQADRSIDGRRALLVHGHIRETTDRLNREIVSWDGGAGVRALEGAAGRRPAGIRCQLRARPVADGRAVRISREDEVA